MTSSKKVSLSEVNQSIDTPNNNRFWQNLKAFLGPGALCSRGLHGSRELDYQCRRWGDLQV